MKHPNHYAIARNVSQLRDELRALGVPVPFSLKRRDPLEPGRTEKEAAEDKIFALFMKQFRKQRKEIKELLERFSFDRKKAISDDVGFLIGMLDDAFFVDPLLVAQLSKILRKAIKHGIELFGSSQLVQIDYTLTNAAAAEFATSYTFDLIEGINKTTVKSLQNVFKSFIETPGMTIGDVVALLPFEESRALMIATTEITNIYANADQIAGEELQKEFPDVQVIKTWWTNNDDRVCPICGPLHGTSVPIDQPFVNEGLGMEFDIVGGHVGCRCWQSSSTRIIEQ